MFRLLHLGLFVCLFCILWVVTSLFLYNEPGEAAQMLVAFEFTPIPTTNAAAPEAEKGTTLHVEQFTVQIETAIQEPVVIRSRIVTAPISAEISQPTPTSSLPAPPAINNKPTVQPARFANRATLERHFNRSHVALSSLTYLINLAEGDGIVACDQVAEYYEQVTTFDHFKVAAPLRRANDHYIRSLNVATIGVNPLYRVCQQQLVENPDEGAVAVRLINPATWSLAVSESNAALALNNSALEWFDGSTRLLTNVYQQFESELDTYAAMLSTPTVESCSVLRDSYEQMQHHRVSLDLGEGSQFFSSYDKYERAARSIRATGEALYLYCDPAVGGLGQMTSANAQPSSFDGAHSAQVMEATQSLPIELVESARSGSVEAKSWMGEAYYYISPASMDDQDG